MGKGERQEKEAHEKRKLILDVLSDGEWHRHKEILEKTRLSPTTLSKHLKELEKGLVEKRIDIESGEYPYPVYYRLKGTIPKEFAEWISVAREIKEAYEAQIREYVKAGKNQILKHLEEVNLTLNHLVLHAIEGFLEFGYDYFEQVMKNMILSWYYDEIKMLAEAFREAKEEGLDAVQILQEVQEPFEKKMFSSLKKESE